jgi:hypothetical protein
LFDFFTGSEALQKSERRMSAFRQIFRTSEQEVEVRHVEGKSYSRNLERHSGGVCAETVSANIIPSSARKTRADHAGGDQPPPGDRVLRQIAFELRGERGTNEPGGEVSVTRQGVYVVSHGGRSGA